MQETCKTYAIYDTICTKICKKYAKIRKQHAKYAKKIHTICKKMCTVCKKYAKNMHNMQKNMQRYKPICSTFNIQNKQKQLCKKYAKYAVDAIMAPICKYTRGTSLNQF